LAGSGKPYICILFQFHGSHIQPPDLAGQPDQHAAQTGQFLRRGGRVCNAVGDTVMRLAQRQALAFQRTFGIVQPMRANHPPRRASAQSGARRRIRQAQPRQPGQTDLAQLPLYLDL
jgi:hypothetical protein